MEEWLRLVTKETVIVIDAGCVDRCCRRHCQGIFHRAVGGISCPSGNPRFRAVLLRYGGWLVAGLTFQRATDIIETSSIPSDSFWCANKNDPGALDLLRQASKLAPDNAGYAYVYLSR